MLNETTIPQIFDQDKTPNLLGDSELVLLESGEWVSRKLMTLRCALRVYVTLSQGVVELDTLILVRRVL